MECLILASLISFIVNGLTVKFGRVQIICDTCEGEQKFHEGQVPRIGGCGIYLSALIVSIFFILSGRPFAFEKEMLLVLACAFPLFLSGLLEDLTKRISPRWRLVAGFVAASLGFFILSARIGRVNVPGLDYLLEIPFISFLFTLFAVAGVSNAFNIIDGFNGLASGIAMFVFATYAYVTFVLHDQSLMCFSLTMFFGTLGFFIWNYPFGSIFLGDCGSYLLGYVAATLGILITVRHPQVSCWFPLLLVIHPVWETIFSMYRRKFLKKISPSSPDGVHLHSLIYRRVVRQAFGKKNAFTSPYFWTVEFFCAIFAGIFWENTLVLAFCVLAFIVFYSWLYFRIVQFKTPKLLFLWRERSSGVRTRGLQESDLNFLRKKNSIESKTRA